MRLEDDLGGPMRPDDSLGGRLVPFTTAQPPATIPPPPRERRVFGKPVRWARGWTVVLVVWLVAGAALLAARLDMGHLTAWSPREAAAVERVQAYSPDSEHRTDELLAAVADALTVRYGYAGGPPHWYAFERAWEGKVYVVWEWRQGYALSFTVGDGEVHPDDEARLILRTVARSLSAR
jgi:hypothetical protein